MINLKKWMGLLAWGAVFFAIGFSFGHLTDREYIVDFDEETEEEE